MLESAAPQVEATSVQSSVSPTKSPVTMRAVAFWLCAALAVAVAGEPFPAPTGISFSAGFTDNAVFQRSATVGVAVYGFTATASPLTISVTGVDGAGKAVGYTVQAAVAPWRADSRLHRTRFPTWALGTCGDANEIELTAAYLLLAASCYGRPARLGADGLVQREHAAAAVSRTSRSRTT